MLVDFSDAANRHWKVAECLLKDKRWANADQLFGLYAECALKAVLSNYRLNFERDHIDKLWDNAKTFACGMNAVKCLAHLSCVANPFDNWKVDQRYWNSAYITEDIVKAHK
ncbi:MAG: hypothetical protein HQK97_11075 [Nitrospirae bacterium]|nr:hypothetical protein [Nitrospirota bacterium]